MLKGGVKLRQRRLVNEVLGLLVTEFVRNFSREDATPYQRGSNSGLLSRIQAVKFVRHNTWRIFQSPHIGRASPVARTRSKVDQKFWCPGSTSKFLDEQNPKRGQSDQGMFGPKSSQQMLQSGKG